MRRLAALLLLLLLAAPARADLPRFDAGGVPEVSLGRGLPGGFADPWGHRAWLAQRGINYNLWYRTDVLGNLSGGQRRGWVNQGLFEPSLLVDFGRLAGIEGLTLFSNAFLIHNTGRIRRDYVGGVNTIAAIEAVPTARLSELWLEMALPGGWGSVRAGQLAADVEFFFADAAFMFLQSDFPTITALNLPSGGPAFPLATPGIRLRLEPMEGVSTLLALFNGDPSGPGPGDEQRRNPSGTAFRVQDRPLLMGEAQFRANQEAGQGLARTLRLGGWGHLGRFDDPRLDADRLPLADPLSSGLALRRRGQWGLYAVGEQQLWRPAGGDAESGLTVFSRVSASPARSSVISFFADAGVVLAGVVPGRPEDRLGFSVMHARFSEPVRAADRDAAIFGARGGRPRSHETNLELTYVAELMPGITVQPVVTKVWNPGGEPGRHALVAGARLFLRF